MDVSRVCRRDAKIAIRGRIPARFSAAKPPPITAISFLILQEFLEE
jgi:hypothetical protein